jgi:hypothetical protein
VHGAYTLDSQALAFLYEVGGALCPEAAELCEALAQTLWAGSYDEPALQYTARGLLITERLLGPVRTLEIE